MVLPLWKTLWRFLKKIKIDPAIPLLGIYPKELKSESWRDIGTPMSITALVTIAEI